MSIRCGVCDTHVAKYKCPSCQLQYCSIKCYKGHQTTHTDRPSRAATHSMSIGLPPKPPATVALTNASNFHTNAGEASFETYSRPTSSLESSADLQILYTRYPQLRDQLKEIYHAATQSLDDQLNDHRSCSEHGHRGRSRGRSTKQGRDGRIAGIRSRHGGVKSGIRRLRTLRYLKGEDGDGLREFSELVTSPFEGKKSISIALNG